MQTAIANGVPQGTSHFLDHLFAGKAQDVISLGKDLDKEMMQGVVYSSQFSEKIGCLRFRLLTTLIFRGADRNLATIPAWQDVVHRLTAPAILYRKNADEPLTEETLRTTLSLPAADAHYQPSAESSEMIDLAGRALDIALPVLAFRRRMENSLAEGGKWPAETRSKARGKIETLASFDDNLLPKNILKYSDENVILSGFYAYLVLFQTCRSIPELCDLVSLGQKLAERYPQFKTPLEELTASRCTRLPDSAASPFSTKASSAP